MGHQGGRQEFDWQAAHAAGKIISGRWNLLVLAALEDGPRGHRDLAATTRLSGTQLARTLRGLGAAGLVEREVDVVRPPVHVSYRRTPRASVLLDALVPLARWYREEFRTRPREPGGR